MDRRDALKSLAAVPLVAALPALSEAPPAATPPGYLRATVRFLVRRSYVEYRKPDPNRIPSSHRMGDEDIETTTLHKCADCGHILYHVGHAWPTPPRNCLDINETRLTRITEFVLKPFTGFKALPRLRNQGAPPGVPEPHLTTIEFLKDDLTTWIPKEYGSMSIQVATSELLEKRRFAVVQRALDLALHAIKEQGVPYNLDNLSWVQLTFHYLDPMVPEGSSGWVEAVHPTPQIEYSSRGATDSV
jgi:hypothetical protein